MGRVERIGDPQVVAEKCQTNQSMIDWALANAYVDERRFLENRKLEDTSLHKYIA